jgi:hypothetical protein
LAKVRRLLTAPFGVYVRYNLLHLFWPVRKD